MKKSFAWLPPKQFANDQAEHLGRTWWQPHFAQRSGAKHRVCLQRGGVSGFLGPNFPTQGPSSSPVICPRRCTVSRSQWWVKPGRKPAHPEFLIFKFSDKPGGYATTTFTDMVFFVYLLSLTSGHQNGNLLIVHVGLVSRNLFPGSHND